jgi:hypothetical protein
MVTLSTRSHAVAATIASNSANPGLTPEPKSVDPPFWQASSSLALPSPRLWPVMKEAEATTFTPADRMATNSSTSIHIGCRRRSRVSAPAARPRHWWPRHRVVRFQPAHRRRVRPCLSTRRSSRRARSWGSSRSPLRSFFRHFPSSTGRPDTERCCALAQHRVLTGPKPAWPFLSAPGRCGRSMSRPPRRRGSAGPARRSAWWRSPVTSRRAP